MEAGPGAFHMYDGHSAGTPRQFRRRSDIHYERMTHPEGVSESVFSPRSAAAMALSSFSQQPQSSDLDGAPQQPPPRYDHSACRGVSLSSSFISASSSGGSSQRSSPVQTSAPCTEGASYGGHHSKHQGKHSSQLHHHHYHHNSSQYHYSSPSAGAHYSYPPGSYSCNQQQCPHNHHPSHCQCHHHWRAPTPNPPPPYVGHPSKSSHGHWTPKHERMSPPDPPAVRHPDYHDEPDYYPHPHHVPHHSRTSLHQPSSASMSHPPYTSNSNYPTYGTPIIPPPSSKPSESRQHRPSNLGVPPPPGPTFDVWDPPQPKLNCHPRHATITATSSVYADGEESTERRKRSGSEHHNHHSLVTPTPKKLKTVDPSYNRKKKSLGLLAETFLQKYQEEWVYHQRQRQQSSGPTYQPEIIIDELAKELTVERRRIYDVVNILEAVQLVVKKGKNTYLWIGTDHLPEIFGQLQKEAIHRQTEDAIQTGLIKEAPTPDSWNEDSEESKDQRDAASKSLSRLSQLFLQVFLLGHETMSLPEASDKIHGTTTSMEDLAAIGTKNSNEGVPAANSKQFQLAAARGLKTKIRRLYDIANVFLSVGFLAKVDDKLIPPELRRPRFSWAYHKTPQEILKMAQRQRTSPASSTTSKNGIASTPSIRRSAFESRSETKSPPSSASTTSSSASTTDSCCDPPPTLIKKKKSEADSRVWANIHQTGGAVCETDDIEGASPESRRVSLPADEPMVGSVEC